ncbi:hypothetical protein [Mesorhizobium sp. B2-4-19]|uniref:hypothetical protein n=1 Tax=Mesorhizobium sp. B2-4-19 TaxID=2589930 RepID=UPI0032B29024
MGKTTLPSAIVEYLPATSGKIEFDGGDLTKTAPTSARERGWDSFRKGGRYSRRSPCMKTFAWAAPCSAMVTRRSWTGD